MRPDKHIGTVVGGYALEALIGWGKSSKVYRARHQLTGHVQAIKVITKVQSHVGVLHQSLPECTVMGKLKHPNIVELNQWFETEKRIYLIMELAKDGDVLSILNRAQRPLPEETVQNWFVQLIDALSFAHARNFVHGDLRLENILLDGNRVLLADWGSAHTFYAGVPCADFTSRALAYCAPEILARRPYLASQAECWALGVVLYALACGKLPFDRTAPDFASDVATANFPMPPHVSVRLRSMIHGLLSPDPIIRFSLFDVQHHDFFTSSKSNVFPLPVCGALRSSASAPLASITGNNKYNPAPRGNSGSDVGRRNTAPAAAHVRVHELRDSPPRSPSFSRSGSAVRLRREPPSPAQSEPSSRISVPQPEEDSDACNSLADDREQAVRGGQTPAPAPRGQGSPESKPKKPLSRVFAFIKHLPSRVLGGSNNVSVAS